MKSAKTFTVVTFALTAFLFSSSAQAALVHFTFTGTGVNGSIAFGSFTVDEVALYPGYFATGGIFPSLSLTITNIPPGGPATASFDVNDLASTWFAVDAGGVPYIAPYGSKSYGFPDQNHYDLGQPSQPYLPSAVFETPLGYNLVGKDLITWSAATPVNAPEPGSASLILTAVVIGTWALRGRKFRLPR